MLIGLYFQKKFNNFFFFFLSMQEKVDRDLFSFLIYLIFNFKVIVRVGNWFVKIFTMFLKYFLNENKLEIEF